MVLTICSSFFLFGIGGLMIGAWSKPISQGRGGSCPKGWTQVDCRCFIFQDEEREFADAESVCNILGGNLASVHSALENAIIVQLNAAGTSDPSSDIWIGLHEAIEEDTFFWTDGSAVDFTNFNSDNDSGDCLVIENDDVLWDKDPCNVDNKYVCARNADQRDPPYKPYI